MSIDPSWRVCPDETTPSQTCPTETAAHHAARLLAQDPGRDWRLQDLADLVHLSTSQLGRAFSQRFGMPPIQYLAHVRAHRLAELLIETDLPIGAAMTQVGWRSRGHAARQFTKLMGVTPSAYRAECRQRTQRTEADPTGCLWFGQPLPAPENDGDLLISDGDQITCK